MHQWHGRPRTSSDPAFTAAAWPTDQHGSDWAVWTSSCSAIQSAAAARASHQYWQPIGTNDVRIDPEHFDDRSSCTTGSTTTEDNWHEQQQRVQVSEAEDRSHKDNGCYGRGLVRGASQLREGLARPWHLGSWRSGILPLKNASRDPRKTSLLALLKSNFVSRLSTTVHSMPEGDKFEQRHTCRSCDTWHLRTLRQVIRHLRESNLTDRSSRLGG